MKKITITLILASSMGFATDISGTVSGTWGIDDSPYYVVGNTTVSSGQTLTIEPGVEIVFNGNYCLQVNGTLSCVGTSDNKIYFHGAGDTPQGSISFDEAETAPVLTHCRIENLDDRVFIDDFEDGLWDDVWDATIESSGGATGSVEIANNGANGSDSCLFVRGYESDTYVISEAVTVSSICKISFNLRTTTDPFCYVEVYWRKNGDEWVAIFSEGGNSYDTTPWRYYSFDISESVSLGDQVELRFFSNIYNTNNDRDNADAYWDNVAIGTGGAIVSNETVNISNTAISNNSGYGIYSKDNIILTNTGVSNSGGYGIYSKSGDITLTGSYVKGSGGYGIFADDGNLTLKNSYVANNGAQGVYTSMVLDLDYAVIAYNAEEGIQLESNQFSTIDNSILWHNDNDDHQQISLSNGIVNTTYSNVQGSSSFGINGYDDGQFVWGAGCIESNPVFTDSSGTLSANSPCVDAAAPWQHDANMPPGLGTIVADMGAYGGPNNTVWGGTAIPDGEPVIDHIVDLPADQGGTVGIQYSASIFDYGHTGYDITSYSFWRELDVGRSGVRSQISAFPQGPYFVTSRDNYWEQIGTMDAQGFENYGYSAATLADSSADGIFWSKHLVVAHTPDDNIFFVSDPDSGYSVDNIPPTPPNALFGTFDDGTLTASWEDEINPDILHYDVYRNGSSFLETAEPEFTDDTFDLGDSAVFTIRGVDIHDNTGEFSDPFTATYGTKGDVTWDGIINILDVTKILYIILFPDEEVTDEEFWAGNYNSDEGIDVVDVTPVVDIILGGLLSNMENSGGETMVYLQDNTLMLTSYRPITGIQVLLSDNTTVSNLTSLSMAAEANKVLVYTLTGDVLQGVDIPVLTLGSDAVIEDIILVDNLGQRVSSVLEIVEEDLIPDEFAIHQNYPNPFNPSTLIKLDVNKPMHSKISVYDIMGREVNVLVDEKLQPGYHQFIWDGTDSKGIKAGSGLYFILVQTPEVTRTMKATLLR